ncbi:Negative elongation factor C/D [Oopsacas minuta]|uniref:Negative elongation factor C/D n=1 Tax=Oopsacas minuta TaxID=111878 RepID=A0AAV7K7W0_9METZ|nr:Negative elongation factor C/D [Oopsacas minuta]
MDDSNETDTSNDISKSLELPQEQDTSLEHDLSQKDFILEPSIYPVVDKYIADGHALGELYEMLFESYECAPFAIYVLQGLLTSLGYTAKSINELNMNHFADFVMRNFDPKKADEIFSRHDIPPWLETMINEKYWRQMIYKLLDLYPDCLMLKLMQDLIANSGYHSELINVKTASTNFQYFQTILNPSLTKILFNLNEAVEPNSKCNSTLKEFTQLALNSQHAYFLIQTFLDFLTNFDNILALTKQDTDSSEQQNKTYNQNKLSIRYLSHYLTKQAKIKGIDVTRIDLLIKQVPCDYQVLASINSILTKDALHISDANTIYEYFRKEHSSTGSVLLLRIPQFLRLLVDEIYHPNGSSNTDHVEKCIFLLAYAVTMQSSDISADSSPPDNQAELQETIEVIQMSSSICKQLTLNLSDVPSHFSNLIQFISYPVVSKGVLCWFTHTVRGSEFFQVYPIHGPIYFVLLDEISEKHSLLHPDVFELLTELFEATNQGIEIYHELELQQTVLDHMIHLFVCGYSIEVMSYILDCSEKGCFDQSLIRHFVSEVLNVIVPPYSSELTHLLYAILAKQEICVPLQNADGTDVVSEFLAHAVLKSKKKRKPFVNS